MALLSASITPTNLVTTSGAATLTNKTLTSPTVSGATLTGGTINNMTVGATTPSTGAFTNVNTLNTFGFKNRIINGAMVFDQRNAGASVTPTAAVYSLDRWIHQVAQSNTFSIQQSTTAPTGFINSLLITSLAATSVGVSENNTVEQYVEGLNCTDFGWGTASAQAVTLSFWVRSSLTGTFGGCFQNSDNTRSYVFSYTISAANTWEKKSVTIDGDTSGTWLTTNGIGIKVRFSIGVGTNLQTTAGSWASANYRSVTGETQVLATNGATWRVSGVQLETGSTATSFDFRSHGTELSLCQRYFHRAVNGNSQIIASAFYYSNADVRGIINFPCTMRVSPTLVSSSGTDHFRIQAVSADDTFNTLLDAGVTSTTSMYLYINSNVSGTAGDAGAILSNNANSSLAFSSEF